MTPPIRHWLSYRLRTLLIVVAVVAVPLAWVAKERRQSAYEERVAAQLEHEGAFRLTFSDPFDSIDSFWAGESTSWWRKLAALLRGERILIANAETRPVDLTQFVRMSNLQELEIWTDHESDLTPLTSIASLKKLTVHAYECDLSPLMECKALEELFVNWPLLLDLTQVSRLTNLRMLYIDGGKIRDLKPLFGMHKLTYLRLDEGRYTANQIEALQKALPDCQIDLY